MHVRGVYMYTHIYNEIEIAAIEVQPVVAVLFFFFFQN